jgi:prevent-host-death family protein
MINAHEAQLQLIQLLQRVQQGEQIIIAEEGLPIARLVPLKEPIPPRKPGSAAGQIIIADDFDAPLPDTILEAFER